MSWGAALWWSFNALGPALLVGMGGAASKDRSLAPGSRFAIGATLYVVGYAWALRTLAAASEALS